ncbi:MAG: leucyl aminopeptidase [Verrucomicrobiales bacterium]
MKVVFSSPKPATSGLAVVPVFSDAKVYGVARDYGNGPQGALARALKRPTFSGKAGATLVHHALESSKLSGLYFRGVGELESFDVEKFAAEVLADLGKSGETTLTIHLDGFGVSPDAAARAVVGARLAAYQFLKYRTTGRGMDEVTVKTLRVVIEQATEARSAYQNFHGPVCDGQLFARDLVTEPSNELNPKSYAARIRKMKTLGLQIEVLGEKKMRELGMNALVGVGLGSQYESQLVVMKWNGAAKSKSPVCLVGKGVTFDTGGISLKPGAGMWDMKVDMGGSAAVVGAMHALAARKAKVNVVGIVGLVENMPDAKAQNPGDVVTSMSGQTIEVQNTDAEGRLVLADALTYANRFHQPKAMVNLATLTGAVMVALGSEHAGLFSNSDEVAEGLKKAADVSTEKVWRLPLDDAYDRLIDSQIADMKNIGGREAGSITAAQFLQRFVGDTPWAHLDIAGTASKNTRTDPREPSLATGFGVRLLNQWIADHFEG